MPTPTRSAIVEAVENALSCIDDRGNDRRTANRIADDIMELM